jgi:predicted nuclease of predicted toxin-antitoxin system
MRFLLDESADYPLAAYLRGLGHDVTAIAHDYPAALADRQVLQLAQAENRILVTNDRDFGELVVRQRLPHAGLILFRLGEESIATKVRWLAYVLANHQNELQHLIVVTDQKVRVRRFSP